MMRWLSSGLAGAPNIIAPRQRAETLGPVRPSVRYSIGSPPFPVSGRLTGGGGRLRGPARRQVGLALRLRETVALTTAQHEPGRRRQVGAVPDRDVDGRDRTPRAQGHPDHLPAVDQIGLRPG